MGGMASSSLGLSLKGGGGGGGGATKSSGFIGNHGQRFDTVYRQQCT